jgi:hypothetical protein
MALVGQVAGPTYDELDHIRALVPENKSKDSWNSEPVHCDAQSPIYRALTVKFRKRETGLEPAAPSLGSGISTET